MSALPAIGGDRRPAGRCRDRGSFCTQAPMGGATESRADGVPAGGRPTLGQLLEGTWEGLRAGGSAECPLCHGRLRRAPAEAAARCESCGAALS